MSNKQQSITSLPQSPDEERRGRVLRYSIAMGIRVLCVVLALLLHGWPQLLAILGAIALPYFAVVVANEAVRKTGAEVTRPGPIAPRELGR